MADILVRDVAETTVAEIDRRAKDLGLSRAEFLRRHLDVTYRAQPVASVSTSDWRRFHAAAADLDDPDVMAQAWS